MKAWRRWIWLSCLLVMPFVALASQPHVLRVGVINGSPFTSQKAGQYQGMVIELWQNIADDNHWGFQYVPTSEDADQTLRQLQAGQFDVVIGPLSVNQPRLKMVDFSRPYFINNIGVLAAKRHYRLRDVFSDFLPSTFVAILISLAGSFLIYLNVLWFFERGKHPDVHAKYHHAMRQGFWHHVIKGGFSEMPHTTRGKITLLLWGLWAALMVSIFNASISAAFTVSLAKQRSTIASFEDLTQVRVIGVAGQASADLAQRSGLFLNTVATLPEAIQALQLGKADALVFDQVPAQDYLNAHHINNLELSDLSLAQEEYAFALRYNSPYLHPINMSIVKFQDNGLVGLFCQKYMGEQAKYCQL